MATILVTIAGVIKPGDMIAEPDDLDATTWQANQEYRAEDQVWQEVVAIGGHADIGTIVFKDETVWRGDWGVKVWKREESDVAEPDDQCDECGRINGTHHRRCSES